MALMLVVVSTMVTLGAGELVLRAALFSEVLAVPALQMPWRFADSNSDEDSWKLAYLFYHEDKAQRVGHIDPELGWAPAATDDNPLGLISDRPYSVAEIVDPILFYGDSFVAGASPIPARIPQVMDRLLPRRTVLNYGVGGYGVDQIYLRFVQTAGRFERPLVLIGVLTQDLDRSVLGMRTGQKPYFDVVDDELVLRNLPIHESTREYVEQNPPQITSYLFRLVALRLRPHLPDGWIDRLLDYDDQHRRKLRVNRRILRAFRDEAKERGLDLRFVLFYSESELAAEGWREVFLKSTLSELGIEYFDTKGYLLGDIEGSGRTVQELYYRDNGHPNVEGNDLIARGIIDWLEAG